MGRLRFAGRTCYISGYRLEEIDIESLPLTNGMYTKIVILSNRTVFPEFNLLLAKNQGTAYTKTRLIELGLM